MKEQDKTPGKTTKWSGNRKSTWERVHYNDHKDDPRTQKTNGCTEWEVIISFKQREKIQRATNRVDEYNNWNENNTQH